MKYIIIYKSTNFSLYINVKHSVTFIVDFVDFAFGNL